MPQNIEELVTEFYLQIEGHLPSSLLSIISTSKIEDTLMRWHFLAILASNNKITFKIGHIKEREEPYAYFEDVEVIPL